MGGRGYSKAIRKNRCQLRWQRAHIGARALRLIGARENYTIGFMRDEHRLITVTYAAQAHTLANGGLLPIDKRGTHKESATINVIKYNMMEKI